MLQRPRIVLPRIVLLAATCVAALATASQAQTGAADTAPPTCATIEDCRSDNAVLMGRATELARHAADLSQRLQACEAAEPADPAALAACAADLTDARAAAKTAQDEAAALTARLADQDAAHAAEIAKLVAEQEARLAALDAEIEAKLAEQEAAHQARLDALTAERQEAQDKLALAETKAGILEAETEKQARDIAALTAERDAALIEAAEAAKNLDLARADLADARARIAELDKEVEAKVAALGEAEREIAALEDSVARDKLRAIVAEVPCNEGIEPDAQRVDIVLSSEAEARALGKKVGLAGVEKLLDLRLSVVVRPDWAGCPTILGSKWALLKDKEAGAGVVGTSVPYTDAEALAEHLPDASACIDIATRPDVAPVLRKIRDDLGGDAYFWVRGGAAPQRCGFAFDSDRPRHLTGRAAGKSALILTEIKALGN